MWRLTSKERTRCGVAGVLGGGGAREIGDGRVETLMRRAV